MQDTSSSLAAMSAMDAPMSCSLGAMGPLLRKLDSLLRPDYRLPKLLKGRIELLKADLEEISASLLEQSTVDSPNEMAKFWMNEVRELSYNIEDFVDSMMSKHADAKMRSVKSYRVGRVKIAWLPKTLKPSTRAAKITELRALVRESIGRHDTYLDGCISNSRFVFTGQARVPVLYAEAASNLVGVDDLKLKLTRGLTQEEERQLKVVAIVGPAGVGKTTLAKQVYHELGEQFECRAFVRASRKPDMRRLLGGILSQVQGCRRPFEACTVQNLIDNLTEHLQDKRYVIVIDDLWETTAWDILTNAFPEGNNHSRIIATAEMEGVALECCHYQSNHIFEMKPLGREDSTELLFSLIFGPERLCPEELNGVVDIITTKCAGLPLATICVAGLLTSQPGNTERWQHVQECLCSSLSTNSTLEETMQEVLKISYNSLPHYLKTCLMHLYMYPEGYTMWKVDLVKQWIAEGFIGATEGTEIEEVADSYFGELVNRGMIQPVDINYNAEVLSCTLRNVVLDLITHESSEENFITALDYSQTVTGLYSKAHRLSLHFSNTRYAVKPTGPALPKFRSLGFFGILECVPSVVEFKLLRVLILEFWGDHRGSTSFNLTRICRLAQLRYLKISCDASVEVELPTQVRMLRHLETLIIDAVVSAVPLDIIHLPGLWHLSLGNKIDLPDEIGRIRSLRTLHYFDVHNSSEDNILSLGDLMNLQDLHLTYFKESDEHPTEESVEHLKRNLRVLASSLTKLVNLKSVTLAPGASSTTIYLDVRSSMPSPSVFLQRLELLPPICIFSRLPEWIGQLQKLCILKVVVSQLLMKDMDMLIRLPALTILSLYVRQPTTERFIFKRGAFLGLKYFKYTSGVLPLTFQEGAFPNLQRLELNFNAHRGAQYFHFLFGIDHLLNLKKIVGTIGAAADAEEPDRRAAESAFKDAIRKHSRFPSYDNVKRVDRVCEDYQLRTQEKDSSSEKHEILQKKRRKKEGDSSDDQFRILLKETEEDTKQHFDGNMTLSTMAVSASTGVMNSLLGKLTTLMGDEYRKLKGVRNKVVSLHEEFNSMNALLVKLAGMDELDVQAKMWRDQVRDMSYDIEDCIDDFMHDLEVKGATTGFLKKTAERLKKLKVRHQIANKIMGIEVRVLEVNERRIRYKLDEYNPTSSIVHIDPRALAIFADAAGLVGIDTPRDELIELLMDQGQEVKVGSIVGFGGLGKTTLANEVCRKIEGQFTCHAFVSVSLKPDIPKLLQNLLFKLTEQESSPSSSLDDVIRKIREYLLNKRYLIIIDDLWDTSAWGIIKCAFPENNHGSRVLTTTRIYSVAAACCSKSRGCVYKMKSLNDHDSRRMFFSRIFGSEDSCPTELEDVSIDILKKCGGLPLAIISISSILADQPKPTFEYVRKSLGCMFDGNPTLDQMRQILELSFRNLPNHLKTCLLYLGMYPEDHEIYTVDLLRQWIAEGFICGIPGLDAEDIAISYFNELINRSMIQPVGTNVNGEVLCCRVHDIMLDVIRSKMEEENFISVLNDPEVVLGMHRNIRRASLQCSYEECRLTSAMANGSLSKVWSVYVFGGFSCQSLMLLKYVRVLHLDIGTKDLLDLTGISSLFLLRYVKVVGRVRLELPSQIGKLQQLETLDLENSIIELPSDIASLPLLLHLIVRRGGGIVFPDGIGRLRLVRTVMAFDIWKNSVENIEGLGEMTSLRDFEFQWTGKDLVEGARRMDVLRSSLERISGSFRILRMYGVGDLDGWSTFSPPPIHLREMWMRGCMFSTIPKWFGHLRDLQTLGFKVKGAGLKDDGVAVLAGLPSLVSLTLWAEQEPLEERVHIPGSGMAFRALKEFNLFCVHSLLTFEAGAMPMLKKFKLRLSLGGCESGGSVEGPPLDGIEHLPAGLREIWLAIHGGRDEDNEAVKSSLKIAFEEHHPSAALRFW